MTNDLIDDMLKRPMRHSFDGLNEMQFGIVFLLWSGILIALELWGAGLSEWASWSWLIALVVVLFLRAITPRLRAKWIHPRIGYVKVPLPLLGKPVFAMILGGIVSFLYIVAVLQWSQFRSSLPAFLGLIFAVGNFVWWIRLRVQRFLAYAILTLASGLVAQWLVPASVGSEAVLCSVSMFYLVGGFLTFRHLMRQPLAAEDQS